ncbi:hypothetical protein MRX96_000206 [Rhipicephalus microplus]
MPVVALLIEGAAEAGPALGAAMVGVAPTQRVDAIARHPILRPPGALSPVLNPTTSSAGVQLFDIRNRRVGRNATLHWSLARALGNLCKHVPPRLALKHTAREAVKSSPPSRRASEQAGRRGDRGRWGSDPTPP